MKAIKANKEYVITEQEKDRYIAEGYDIYENDKVIAYGRGKTVSYEKYKAVVDELEALKEEKTEETEKNNKTSKLTKSKTAGTSEVE